MDTKVYTPTNVAIRVYTARLTAVGTSQPTVKVLHNTTGGTIAWARTGAGTYTGTITGREINITETIVEANGGFDLPGASITLTARAETESTVAIRVSTGGVLADGLPIGTWVEIRLYDNN